MKKSFMLPLALSVTMGFGSPSSSQTSYGNEISDEERWEIRDNIRYMFGCFDELSKGDIMDISKDILKRLHGNKLRFNLMVDDISLDFPRMEDACNAIQKSVE